MEIRRLGESGDDRVGQVFVCVTAGSNGFQRVVVLPIGWVRKAAFHDSRFRIFWIFFQIFSPHGADSPFQTERDTRTQKFGLTYIEDGWIK